MFRKSKRVSNAVRPVIENLQPRMLLSGDATDPGTVALPPDPWPEWAWVPIGRIATPADAGPGIGGIASVRFTNKILDYLSVTVFGTDGDDTIAVTSGPAQGEIRVSGVAGVPDGTVLSGVRDIAIMGGNGNDHITADLGAVGKGLVWGEDGDDVLIATGPVSEMYGGRGNDLIQGSSTYQKLDGGPGNDTIDGGGGNDLLFVGGITPPVPPIPYLSRESWIALWGGVTSGVIVRMDLGTVPNDGFGGQDVISNVRDIEVASYLNDLVYGDGQDNRIVCSEGSDTIYGGDGNDFIKIEEGSGLLSGDEGDDTLYTCSADVILDGGGGQNTCTRDIPGQTPAPQVPIDWIELPPPDQMKPVLPLASNDPGEPEPIASAPAAAMAAPKKKLIDTKNTKKEHVAAKKRAAMAKAAKLKARLKARQAKLTRLMEQ